MDWTRRILGADGEGMGHAAMEKLAETSPPGARGLLMVPTLGGGTSLEGGAEVRGAGSAFRCSMTVAICCVPRSKGSPMAFGWRWTNCAA
ncbi:hypothetical protein [Gemmobacter sp. 24YEA27]|uniref:hypothetical protein n=1 Tax=Gemmobacter sp. 24YEA27 TaxID=3040672 RepID=UPI0024B37AC5|nr:hypothetical protein [Gemmobacter sp. 24YEA27]